MGDTEHTVFDELDEPRESRWYNAGSGRRWHYFQYQPGDRVFATGKPGTHGTVVTVVEALVTVKWDDWPESMPIAAWNLKPVDHIITEDPT